MKSNAYPAEEKALPRVSAIPEARDERGARDIRGERVDVGYENPTTGVGEGVRASWRDRGPFGGKGCFWADFDITRRFRETGINVARAAALASRAPLRGSVGSARIA